MGERGGAQVRNRKSRSDPAAVVFELVTSKLRQQEADI